MTGESLAMEDTRLGPICVVALAGRVDSTNANELLDHLSRLLAMGERAILVDLKGVSYLTSAAFRVLLMATRQADRNATRFALCGVVGQVRELFEMGGLFEAFAIHGSREDAVARMGA